MFLSMQRSMIEPGVRYHPHTAIQPNIPSHITLEAAVDLTKKSEDWRPPSAEQDAEEDERDDQDEDEEDSDSDTPLDMSVSAHSRLTPVFPGFRRDHSPARSERSDHGGGVGGLGPGYYSPVPGARDWSTERSEPDKDEFPKEDGCHLCGMPRSEMAAHDHVEGACNQRPISCLLCSKTFTLWSHYESHKKCHQKMKQRQYPCQSCGKIFTSASNRNMHQRIHKGVRPFHCIPCGVFFRQKAHLQKHQRTQGHIQATELFDKRRADGIVMEHHDPVAGREHDLLEGSESLSEEGSPAAHSSSSSVNEDEGVALTHIKTSPKRKQSHPMHSIHHKYILREDEDEGIEEEEERLSPREDIIRNNIEYNSISHEYECRECDFSAEDHAATRDHFALDHLRDRSEYQCHECMITFTKLYNLQIHKKKHETSNQFLPCDYCEQAFKVPNKLIKHMEGIHYACPTCGDKMEDRIGLLDHMEKVHNEMRKGIHVNIQHLSSLSSLLPAKHRFDIDSRHAKMRKLDTLTEHIRAKQLQNATGTNVINGNDKSGPHLEPMPRNLIKEVQVHRSIDDHHYTKPMLHSLVTQLHRSNSPLNLNLKSENNNILSSISKMDIKREQQHQQHQQKHHHIQVRHHLHQQHPLDRDELTPPCSPPIADARITSNVVLINNNPTPESDDSNETGLDLTVKKFKVKEENEVTTTEIKKDDEHYNRGRIITPSFPYIVPNLPFIPRVPIGALQPQNNTFTEHLFKLASISRPATVVTNGQSPPKPIVATPNGHHTVLSAMLGHRPPVPAAVFPVFGGNLPPSMFPQHPLPQRREEHSKSPLPTKDSKPFRCSYCPKEFGHLSSLESHIERLHTNESKHHCETCGRAFSSKSNLTAHKKIHTGERPFQCAVCQKRFRQKAHLQKHETTHSSATPYQCPHCDKAFGHPSNLNTHIATHSDVRPYECTDCGKAYKDSASFKRHRLVHSGERPHVCSVCAESFIDSKSLKRHREINHPTEPRGEDEDDDEELIEPGREEQYIIPYTSVVREEEVGGDAGVEQDYDIASNEGDLEIAETTVDSGINSSMENHGNHSL